MFFLVLFFSVHKLIMSFKLFSSAGSSNSTSTSSKKGGENKSKIAEAVSVF